MNRVTDPDSIAGLLMQARQRLSGDSARLDAEVLLAHALQQPRSYLYSWPERVPDAGARARFAQLLSRRARGEPVAYLTGYREFWSLPLLVSADTLIPRPATETLVALALAAIPLHARRRVADLGTGSGAIAIALASERPQCHIVATDRSPAALDVARANAARLQLDNIEFLCGDWCEPLAGRLFDVIVSNPPYVALDDPHLQQGDVQFEPRAALEAGRDGMDALRTLAFCAHPHLREQGLLLLEHGYRQGPAVCELLSAAGFAQVGDLPDASGLGRVARGTRDRIVTET